VAVRKHLRRENVPQNKFLLRRGWGDLSRLGNGERNLLSAKAAGRMSRDANESTWPEAG
jgi:hypothetical protein